MRAVRFDDSIRLVLDEPKPEPGPAEELVRITHAGICRTDLELTAGYMGYQGILGHEFVGRTPDGLRVVGEINCGCGKCAWCLSGDQRHCPTRAVVGIKNHPGVMAEYACLPSHNLLPVPDDLDDMMAVFVEPVAAALEILEQVHVKPADRVVVLGDGKLGQLCAQVLARVAPRTTLVGHYPQKLALARSIGLDTWLHSDEMEIEEVEQALGGRAQVVVDATASIAGFRLAQALTRPRGTLVLKSTIAATAGLNLAPMVIDEITVVGSRCGQFGPALEWLRKERVNPRPLVTDIFPVEEALDAFALAKEKETLKVILTFA